MTEKITNKIPFSYPLVVLKPGSKIVEFLVEICEEKICKVFEKLGEKIISSYMFPHPDKGKCKILQMFILEEARDYAEKVLRSLSVEKITVFTSSSMKMGWGVDKAFFPVTIGDVRLLGLIGPSFIQGVLRLKEKLKYIGEVFLYHLGFNYGIYLAKYLLETMGLNVEKLSMDRILTLVEFFSDYARVVGFAIIEPIHVNTNKYVLKFKMEKCWEAELYLKTVGVSDKPVCSFTRGNIAGAASYVLGKTMTAEETMCEAKGDPYCLVRIRPYYRGVHEEIS